MFTGVEHDFLIKEAPVSSLALIRLQYGTTERLNTANINELIQVCRVQDCSQPGGDDRGY